MVCQFFAPKIALNAVICMITYIFLDNGVDHDYFETSDFIVRFYCFMLKETVLFNYLLPNEINVNL